MQIINKFLHMYIAFIFYLVIHSYIASTRLHIYMCMYKNDMAEKHKTSE